MLRTHRHQPRHSPQAESRFKENTVPFNVLQWPYYLKWSARRMGSNFLPLGWAYQEKESLLSWESPEGKMWWQLLEACCFYCQEVLPVNSKCPSQHFKSFPCYPFLEGPPSVWKYAANPQLSLLQSYILSLMAVNDSPQKYNSPYAKQREFHTFSKNHCLSGASCSFLGCLCCPTVDLGSQYNNV